MAGRRAETPDSAGTGSRYSARAERPTVVIVGLGPAGPGLLTSEATAAIQAIRARYLRTSRHPAAGVVPGAESFDPVYERAANFEDVYHEIVERLVEAAVTEGRVLYAVPGSPLVAERSVEILRSDDRVDVEVVPGLSFVELAWDRLAIDPLAAGVRLVDGPAFAVEAAGERGPLLVGQCWSKQVLSAIKLAVGADAVTQAPATVLQRLGLPDESVRQVDFDELDRAVEPDHLTTVFVPELARPIAMELVRLGELVRTLRERCPWDMEQTHRSLTRHLLEETYEVLDAIEALDGSPASYAHLEEELGDLLFQVYFHSTLAAEEGQFELADVARGVHDKLVGRHPHVFGSVEAATPDAVMANWEQIKRDEKGRASVMEGIPATLPALLQAHKVQRKVVGAGLDPLPPGASDVAKVVEELLARQGQGGGESDGDPGGGGATAADRSVGELLFSVVVAAGHLGVDPEAALRAATAGARQRFEKSEEATRPRSAGLA